MKRRVKQIGLAVFLLLLILGVFFLMNAGNFGWKVAHAALRANGGSMDTSRFYNIAETSIRSYHIIGSISMILGGLGLLLSAYVYYKELED